MSGILTGVAAAGGIVQQAVPTVVQQLGLGPDNPIATLIGVTRSFGGGSSAIIPDVTIDEHHTDRLQVTQHPIANNTPISDHAYTMPAEVTMRCGWSNSNVVAAAAQGFASGLSGGFGSALMGAGTGILNSATEQRAREVYQQLLTLQKGRVPFQLTTGKRVYPSMLIRELTVTTDRHSEYALMLEARMVEVILVSAQVTQTPSLAVQAQPSQTGSPTSTGTVQAQPLGAPSDPNTSPMKTLFGPNGWLGDTWIGHLMQSF